MMNENSSAPMPISEPRPGSFLPKKRIRENEANVIAGMTQALSSIVGVGSALHESDLGEVDRGAVAVDEEHDGEADADLGRGHGHDEEGEHLADDRRLRPPVGAERDEV